MGDAALYSCVPSPLGSILSPSLTCNLMMALQRLRIACGRGASARRSSVVRHYSCDWPDSEKRHLRRFGELRNGAKTKAGPLEAEQLSRLGNIALVR